MSDCYTVAELITALQHFPRDSRVYLNSFDRDREEETFHSISAPLTTVSLDRGAGLILLCGGLDK